MNILQWLHYQYIRKTNFIRWLIIKSKAKDGFLIKEIQGSKMYLNANDRGISYDLMLNGIREEYSTNFVRSLIKKGDIILDVGANIGYYVLMESLIVGEKGKVFAIEPEPRNFELLKKNIDLNKRENVKLFNLAMGDEEIIGDLFVSQHSNMHTLYENKDSNSRTLNKIVGSIKVNVSTLDAFCKKNKIYPDFVRMDVQGYEYNIIKGMKSIMSKKKPLNIFMELHPQFMKKEHTLSLLKMLKDNNFHIIKMFKDYNITMVKFKNEKDVEWNYTIDDIMNDKKIISGSLGTFELFFARD